MATRGIIGRTTPSRFIARYHHWDSTPHCLGKTLYNAYHQVFNEDIVKMMHMIIDEHPAGWSAISGKDLSIPPGFSHFEPDTDIAELRAKQRIEFYQSEKGRRANCYCHGDSQEPERTICSLHEATRYFVTYAYIIDETSHTMTIHKQSGEHWDKVIEVNLKGCEPNWKELN